jgi:hypothetical protein
MCYVFNAPYQITKRFVADSCPVGQSRNIFSDFIMIGIIELEFQPMLFLWLCSASDGNGISLIEISYT